MKQMKMLKRLMKMNSAQLKERAVLQRRILLKHGYTLTTLLIHSGVYIRICSRYNFKLRSVASNEGVWL